MDSKDILIYQDGLDTKFWYQEESSIGTLVFGGATKRRFTSQGLIPMEVCHGNKPIGQYAERIVERDIAQQKLEATWQDYFAANANFPVMALADDGTELRGRIILIKAGEMMISLDEPIEFEDVSKRDYHSAVIMGIVSQDFFNPGMTGFKKDIIIDAQEELIGIYNHQHKTKVV